MVPGLLAIRRRRVDVIVEWRVVQDLVQSTEDVLQDSGEWGSLIIREVLERHLMGLRKNPRLEREPRRVGGEGDEHLVLRDDSLLLLLLCLHDVAPDARAPGRLVVSRRRGGLLHDSPGDNRGRDELGVRVGLGGARFLSVVLEDQDVLEPLVPSKVDVPLLVRREDLLDLKVAEVGEVRVAVGRLHDDLVGADPVYGLEQLVDPPVDLPLDLEGGVLVRHAPDPPARRVRGSVLAVREDLRRRHVLVAVAERALLGRGQPARSLELLGALRADRGEDDPGVSDVVLSELRHRESSPLGGTGCGFGPPYLGLWGGYRIRRSRYVAGQTHVSPGKLANKWVRACPISCSRTSNPRQRFTE